MFIESVHFTLRKLATWLLVAFACAVALPSSAGQLALPAAAYKRHVPVLRLRRSRHRRAALDDLQGGLAAAVDVDSNGRAADGAGSLIEFQRSLLVQPMAAAPDDVAMQAALSDQFVATVPP